MMKTVLRSCLAVLLGLAFLMPSASFAASSSADVYRRDTSVGIKAAESLSQVTGMAISPLLGVGAVGAYKYYRTHPDQRARLSWYAQPWFWVSALAVVALCMFKDAAGPVVPTSLKKPFDVLELFENKISALIATGAIVPIMMDLFAVLEPGDGAALTVAGAPLATAGLVWLGNLILVPVALVVFAVVWLVSHTINVLILVSPFTTVDALLKSFRGLVLSSVVGTHFLDERLGAVWALVVVVVCAFLAPWAFRTTVFGTVFAWDLLSFARMRHAVSAAGTWMFTATRLGRAPHRTFGRLVRESDGNLVFHWRPWLVFPVRTEVLPAGRYLVGQGLIHNELLQDHGTQVAAIFNLPPRCNTHEEALVTALQLQGVRPVGLRAAWCWIRERFTGGPAWA